MAAATEVCPRRSPLPDGVLAQLFPPFVAGAFAPISAGTASSLHSEEQTAVTRSVAARRYQFTAGRACAHAALRTIGYEGQPVGRGSAGEPLWPPGVVGSISHAGDLAGAVVARAEEAWGLGLDVERLEPPLAPNVERLVLTDSERTCIRPQHDLEAYRGKVAFCVKECVHKCLFPATRWVLDFQDVVVEVDLFRSRYRAVVDDRFRLQGLPLLPLEGRFAVVEGYLLAGLCVPPPGPAG
ncbi:MAG: 4'-phosphopantetheinyl transferase superfamily protein [Actinomycetota bacterium]|nr:4'-phosphopantetheinyl transferase superfamily protein [Actinomycetota bacterium]